MRCVVMTGLLAVAWSTALVAQEPSPGAAGFERLKALEGQWIDVDGSFGAKGAVAVTYKVTAGGHAVVETFPVDTANEMVTVYYLDGDVLMLTHYCSANNQPRMRSTGLVSNTLTFDFAGGTNIDPARTSHMHAVRLEFVSADEIRGTWDNWEHGRRDHAATFTVRRKQ